MAKPTKKYTVAVKGFFYGKYYRVGQVMELTEAQAKYELLAGNLKAVDAPEPKPVAGKATDDAPVRVAPVHTPRRRSRKVSETSGL